MSQASKDGGQVSLVLLVKRPFASLLLHLPRWLCLTHNVTA